MKLATFNIYWLGKKEKIVRADADRALIAQVLSGMDADVIAFQEIVDPAELQKIIDLTNNLKPNRSYRTYDKNNQLLGTGENWDQKVVVAFDERQYELVAASPILGGAKRLPFGLRVRSLVDGGQALVIGVHFKSGQPAFEDAASAEVRRLQCQHLADWIAGAHEAVNSVLPRPVHNEHVVILGDFNALYELEPHQPEEWRIVVESLAPLRQAHMKDWWWEKPEADPAGGGRVTAYTEDLLIDFVMLSPSLKNRIAYSPTIYAYDKDPEIIGSPAKDVRYRVSDHRPVCVAVDVSPV